MYEQGTPQLYKLYKLYKLKLNNNTVIIAAAMFCATAIIVMSMQKSNSILTTNSGNTNQSYIDQSIHEATQDNEYTMYSSIAEAVGNVVGGALKFI